MPVTNTPCKAITARSAALPLRCSPTSGSRLTTLSHEPGTAAAARRGAMTCEKCTFAHARQRSVAELSLSRWTESDSRREGDATPALTSYG